MKLFISLLSFIIICGITFSQTATFNDYASHNFEGIKTEDGKLFYATYFGDPKPDTPYNYVIHTFTPELKRVASERVSVGYSNELIDVAEHNGGLLFYIKSGGDGLIYYFDKTGQKAWNRTIEMDKGKFNEVQLFSAGADGFIIVRPDKEKKNGFRITLYDSDINEKWSKAYFPEKGSFDYGQVRMNGDKIAVRSRYQRSAFSSEFEESVHVFSKKDGSLLYKQIVSNEADMGMPRDFHLESDGSTFFIGYIIQDEEFTGLFYKAYSPDGSEVFSQHLPLDDKLAENLSLGMALQNFGLSAVPDINFQSIEKTSTGYRVLGETFLYISDKSQTTGTTTPLSSGTLYVLDYVVLDISASGKLNELRRIGKPHKKIICVGHNIGSDPHPDDYLETFNLFSYRFMKDDNVMLTMNWNKSRPYIGFTSLDHSYENILNRIYLSKTVSGREMGNFIEYELVKKDFKKPLETFHYNVLPYHKPGKMLYYDYEGGQLNMEVMDMKVEPAKPSGDKLAITGIPGREFKGLMSLDNKGFYTLYFGEAADPQTHLYVYHQLDNDLNTTGRSVLTVPKGASFAGNVASGNGHVIVFQDWRDNKWYFYKLNTNGILSNQSSVELSQYAEQRPSGTPLLEEAKDGFYMIQPFTDVELKVPGYEVIRLDDKNNILWTWSEKAESRDVLQIVSTASGNGNLAIAQNQFNIDNPNMQKNKLNMLNGKTGELLYKYDFKDAEVTAVPSFLKILPDNSVICTGDYFQADNLKAFNSKGLFSLKLSGVGNKTFYTKTDWTAVDKSLETGSTPFMISGNTNVLVEDVIIKPDGSYKVIGELFQKSVGTTVLGFVMGEGLDDRAFSIYDFIVFDFNKTGNLSNVYRLPKTEQNIKVNGNIGYQRGYSLSLAMRKYNMFSYLKTFTTEDGAQIIFKNTVDNNTKVYSANLDASESNNYPSAAAEYEIPQPEQRMNKLQMLEQKLDELGGNIEKAMTGTDQTFSTINDPYQGFAVSNPNKTLVYYFDPSNNTLYVKLESLK